MTTRKGHETLAVAVIIACLSQILVSADVYLSPDCPQASSNKTVVNGTIVLKVGTEATCTCVTSGTNPGCAQWISQDGTNSSTCGASATLTFTAKKNQTFTCVEILNGEQRSNVPFSPITIAGPTSAALEANGKSGQLSFDLCPDDVHVSLVCQTPKVDAYDYPYFNFYETNKVIESINGFNPPDTNATGSLLSFTYQYRPAKSGSYMLKCRASNTVFPDMYKESPQIILSVREPPKVNPVININDQDYKDGDKYQVKEDGYIFASCSVTGGSPAVSSVTLTCGDKTLTVTGTKASLDGRKAQRTMAGETCTCSAHHETRCYTLTTSVTLDVAYSPEVINFTINGTETSPIVVERGAYIGFGCYATGNPTPDIFITQESPSSTPLITVTDNKLNMAIQASCDHTDLFYCVVDNGVTAGTLLSRQRYLQVYVKCPPRAIAGNPVNYEATVGKDAVIRINVQAFPNPDKFILYTKKQTVYTTLNIAVDTARYTVVYQPQVAPHGTVIITLINVSGEDFVEYLLDIINGIGDGMSYSFTLREASPDTLSPGAIAGIAVGAAAVVIIVVIIVAACLYTRRGRERDNTKLAGFDSFGKLGVENPGHYYSSAQFPMPNENPYQKPRMHQVAGYPVPKLQDNEDYVDVQDHYDYIPADSVYSASTTGNSVAPTEVDYSGTISSTGGKSIYSATTDNTYLPFNPSSGVSDATLMNSSKY